MAWSNMSNDEKGRRVVIPVVFAIGIAVLYALLDWQWTEDPLADRVRTMGG